MKVDYIIVGFGLAGLSFAEELENHHKSFVVFENGSQQSSRVAGGLYNPVILKRFTAAWKASEQLEDAIEMYRLIEQKLGVSIMEKLPVLRRFNSIEEQNLWFEACDKPVLKEFLSSKLIENDNQYIEVPYQYGEVHKTGRVDIQKVLQLYLKKLEKEQKLLDESFDYSKITISKNTITYHNIEAKHIIFAEGFGIKKNPFFKELPIVGNKGEYLIIKSEELQLKNAIKSSIFIIPLEDNLYKVGATYNNQDKNPEITESAKKEILHKLDGFLKVTYEIVDQMAGVRPTVTDRKPIVGTHFRHKNMHLVNGLGSRGIMTAPWVARKLYNSIEKDENLDSEIDVKRFYKL